MDRDFAASSAMAYAHQQQQQQQQRQAANIQQQQQQQLQFGYPPQHPQVPQHGHPPSMPPHPSLQQLPFHQQFQPPPHPHPVFHQPQQQQPPPPFPPLMPPHLPPPHFHGPYDTPAPPPAPPPTDPELLKRIEKTLEYALKNGPEFEAMIRDKQRDNPAYSFLFGGEGYHYYQYKLFISTRPHVGPFNAAYPSMMPMMHPAASPMMGSPQMLNTAGPVPGPMLGVPPMHQHLPPYYEQQHSQQQPFVTHSSAEHDQSSKPFTGLSGLLPSDVAMELNNILINLNGTKESIKGAKAWFIQRANFAAALAQALKERLFQVNDPEKQLHIIYLVNDILFESLQRRMCPQELDNEALAFKPVLGSMLAVVYHNPQNKDDNQSRLQKILQFWASKEVYDQDTVYGFEGEMISGPPSNFSKTHPTAIAPVSGMPPQTANSNAAQWQMDKQTSMPISSGPDHSGKSGSSMFTTPQQPLSSQQFLPTSVHGSGSFMGSMMQPTSQQPAPQMLQPAASSMIEKPPPYPLFPPGLIPGMVRKMQIGSGVPYSPLSPLDIPTIIPPSTVSQTEILERVSKFFKEIGEVNPSEGPVRNSKDDDDEYECKRESPVRKGGACIPPPSSLQQVDRETGTYPDGTVEKKPGSTSSGRLGLGATANPNEVSQYDDVYSSYRKQRSTNYHSSMSARAVTTTTK